MDIHVDEFRGANIADVTVAYIDDHREEMYVFHGWPEPYLGPNTPTASSTAASPQGG